MSDDNRENQKNQENQENQDYLDALFILNVRRLSTEEMIKLQQDMETRDEVRTKYEIN